MPIEDCIEPLIEASGGKLSRAEVLDMLEEIMSRADSRKGSQSRQAKAQAAAEALSAQEKEAAAIAARNEMMNALKRVRRNRFYEGAPDPTLALEAKLVGVNTPFAGNKMSAGAQQGALRRAWAGGFVTDLERAGLGRLYRSRAIEDDWADELYQINLGEKGSPGITKNADARRIAEIVHKWQKVSVDGLNREGAWIRSYTGYITRSTHDPDRIRKAGQDAWIEQTLPLLDVERTFGTDNIAAIRQGLRDLWVRFKNGDHSRFNEEDFLSVAFDRGRNTARKASESRELHFKTSADWRQYNKAFGSGSVTETVMRALDRAARETALMREFGTNPRAAFQADVARLKDKFASGAERQKLDKWETALTNRFDILDGTANRPVSRLAAAITAGIMVFQRIAKLGLTPFAMLGDLSTKSRALRFVGVPIAERWGVGTISGYFRGPMNSEKREVADLLLAGLDGRIGRIASHFDAVDTPRGAMARVENIFFRYSGISAMTDNQRADAEVIMARHLGMRKGKAFSEIGEREARVLRSYGIEDAEWQLLNTVDWTTGVAGRTYLTPDVAQKIAPDDMAAYLRNGDGALDLGASDAALAAAIERGREDLATKLLSYYYDRGTTAILDVGPRERAILLQGTKPGGPAGIAARLLTQFKAFPTAMITKSWGEELYGGQGRMGAVSGIVELIVSATILGALANALNSAVKQEDPLAPWRNNPTQAMLAGFLRGGAGTIYGDFLFGQWSRFGRTLSGTIAGPTFGQMDAVAELYSRILSGEDPSASAVGLMRGNVPFMNMIYTKAAFDNLILWQIQEGVNPGYLRRMERRAKQQRGAEYWLPPSKSAEWARENLLP